MPCRNYVENRWLTVGSATALPKKPSISTSNFYGDWERLRHHLIARLIALYLAEARVVGSWTKCDTRSEYLDWIGRVKIKAGPLGLASTITARTRAIARTPLWQENSTSDRKLATELCWPQWTPH
jgi:hypothetical protein